MTVERLRELLGRLTAQRVLVLGDAMLDEYIWGDATRVSQEAPVLVVRSRRVSHIPGGAANVLANLRALGAGAALAAVTGPDHAASTLESTLRGLDAQPLRLLVDEDRRTTVKTRVVAQGQQVLRVDHETTDPIPPATAEALLTTADEALIGCGSLLLSDYDKGVLNRETIPRLLALARRHAVRVSVNAKPRFADAYAEVDLLTVNRAEASALAELDVNGVRSAKIAAQLIRERLRPKLTLITLGPDGAVFAADEGPIEAAPAVPVSVADPSGAGDTTIATAHLALTAGATSVEAVELAMLAAGVVVRKLGVATASPDEMLALRAGTAEPAP